MNDHSTWMRRAIDAARAGIEAGQSPFGCAIVRGQELVAACHNEVCSTPDPTAHAEIVALRAAAARLNAFNLSDCRIYTTCEPCPMCAAAIHWSKIPDLIYGASIEDAAQAGFSEIRLPARSLLSQGEPPVRIVEGVEREACLELFERWLANPNRIAY